MDTNLLNTKFARIGARLKVADRPTRRMPGVISLDVQADRKGEFFEIVQQPGAEAENSPWRRCCYGLSLVDAKRKSWIPVS